MLKLTHAVVQVYQFRIGLHGVFAHRGVQGKLRLLPEVADCRAAVAVHAAGGRRFRAGQEPRDCCFSRPVWTDETDTRIIGDLPRDIDENVNGAERLAYAVELEENHGLRYRVSVETTRD